MCGEETPSSTPRIGARVDFFPAAGLTPMHLPVGNLLFLDPTAPSSSHATHVRFQQPLPLAVHPDDTVLVSIHSTGDLTQPLTTASVLQQFALTSPGTQSRSSSRGKEAGIELPLTAVLSLHVGDGGIIGRRVSMRRRGGEVLADGIVGYNFAPDRVGALSC